MNRIGVYLFLALSWLLSKVPNFILYVIADIVYLFLNYIIRYRKSVVYRNLKNSFPEKSKKEINILANKFYHHLSDTFIENIALIKMSKSRILKFVKIEESDTVKELYEKNKSIIGVTGHYGNWEAFLVLPLISSHQVLGVYKPLNNKFFDKQFYKMREKFGAIPVTMNDSYKTVLEHNKNDKLTLLGLIADQRPPKKSSKYWTSFLNQDTPVFLGPEKIAKKLNASILFLYLEKIKRGKYHFKSELLFEDVSNCSDHEITETYLKFLENLIVQKPELYLWSHNRWKFKKEDFINQN